MPMGRQSSTVSHYQQWIGRIEGSTFCFCGLLVEELVQWRQDRWLLPLQMEDHLQAAIHHRQTCADSMQTLCNFQHMYIQAGSHYIQGIM